MLLPLIRTLAFCGLVVMLLRARTFDSSSTCASTPAFAAPVSTGAPAPSPMLMDRLWTPASGS